jgi:hypothetical protein
MTIKIFPADYPYICAICGKQHQAKTRSFFTKEHKIAAADCKWPNKIRDADAHSTSPNPEATFSPKGQPETLPLLPEPLEDKDIDEAIRFAIKRVATHFKLKEDEVMPEMSLVAFVFESKIEQHKERFSLAMAKRIEQTKQDNIAKVQRGR